MEDGCKEEEEAAWYHQKGLSVTQRNSLCLHFLTVEAEDVKGFEICNGIDGSMGSELPSLSCGT